MVAISTRKNRVWFLKPVQAHRDCTHPKCCGKVTLWYRGEEVFRVTARKDQWGEVEDWICNECRFEKTSFISGRATVGPVPYPNGPAGLAGYLPEASRE